MPQPRQRITLPADSLELGPDTHADSGCCASCTAGSGSVTGGARTVPLSHGVGQNEPSTQTLLLPFSSARAINWPVSPL